MANMNAENIDNTGLKMFNIDWLVPDGLLALAGADEIAEGTLLARQRVATAITTAADAGNTGDGTCTLAAVVHADNYLVPKVGAYNLECIAEVANLGIFKLVDPNGAVVAEYLQMAASPQVFEVAGMTFTLTDGAEDFDIGDKFSLTVAASSKLVLFAKDGIGGASDPEYLLEYPVSASGAGDYPVTPIRSGELDASQLIIDADGDNSNIDADIISRLKMHGIIAREGIRDYGIYDNQ